MDQPKRLLIITKYFFPQPNVGAVRMTQWSRFLPEFGWQPTVLCFNYGHLATPELLAEKVHPQVAVEYFNPPPTMKSSIGSSETNYKEPTLWIRALARSPLQGWFVPDFAVVSVWRRVRARTMEVIEKLKPHAILTSSPPHAAHELGMWAAKKADIEWVADFRDPYLLEPKHRPRGLARVRWSAHQQFEAQIYDKAKLITHATPMHARWARRTYPQARSKIVTIYNGFPLELPASVDEVKAQRSQHKPARLSIRVVGFMSADELTQIARALIQIVARGKDVELRLVGQPPENVVQLGEMLGDRLVVVGVVRHDEAMRQIAGADTLVCIADLARAQLIGLSTKVFEYVATGKPVILLNPKRPDRQFVRKLQGIRMLDTPSDEQVAEALEWALDPESCPPPEQVERFRREFNRRDQAKQLAVLLDATESRTTPAKILRVNS